LLYDKYATTVLIISFATPEALPVQIVNQPVLGGGFRHYSGLCPTALGGGDPFHASVRLFAVPASNASAIFRGDIVTFADAAHGVQGGSDIIPNIGPPAAASVVIGNAGGSQLGNASIAPNIARWVPGDAGAPNSIIAGVVVGFGPISLYMAKNGFQYIPASTQAWVYVETDPDVEMDITVPTVPGTAFNLLLNDGADVQANAGFQATRFGISGVSLNPAIAATSTLPLRILSSGHQIGNDPTSPGFVAHVTFNRARHYKGAPGTALVPTTPFVPD
jgi:hypothetical protein